MNKKNKFLALLLTIMMMVMILPNQTVFADDSKTYVRVEGVEGTIISGEASGKTVYEVLQNLLDGNGVSYTLENGSYGPYLTEVDGLTSGKFGGYDGWMYFIQNGSSIISDRSDIETNDEVVFYYGDYDKTALINDVTFMTEIPKENEEFKLKLQYSYFDWQTNETKYKALQNVKCNIDDKTYTTNEEGIISLTLKNGEHKYEFSGYNKNDVPSVVMTKGTFTLDGVNKPTILFSDSNYKNLEDNKNNDIDLKKTMDETANYMLQNNKSPWGAFSLYKLGMTPSNTFLDNIIKDASEDISVLSGTELETSMIGMATLGYNPKKFMDKDYVKELLNRDVKNLLTNDIMFGLLTMRALNIKDEYKITKSDLVNELLARYDEGWNWTTGLKDKADVDMTSAAISALSPYYNGTEISNVDINDLKTKVNNAVEIISSKQIEDGNIASTYGVSCETNSYVIIALTSIGIDPTSDKFTKEKGNLVDALLSYKGDNGAFNHSDKVKNNLLATENALRAIIALNNFDKTSAYDYYSSNIDIDKLKSYNSSEEEEKKEENKKEETEKKEEVSNKADNSDETETSDDNMKVILALSTLMIISLASMTIIWRKKNEA